MEEFNPDCILCVLEAEGRWLTFDELLNSVDCNCAWTVFAAHLERLVEQGKVLYVLPYGADVGYYGINGYRLQGCPSGTPLFVSHHSSLY